MNFKKLIKSGLGFLSSIPTGISMNEIYSLMNQLYIYPIIGTILGLLIGIGSMFSYILFPSYLATTITICLIYYIILFNHLDGIADFGDGIIAHGNVDKKRKILKDTTLGIGAVGFVFFYLLLLYTSLLSLYLYSNIFFNQLTIKYFLFFGIFSNYFSSFPILFISIVLLQSEVCAKQSMLTISAYGKEFHDGFGSITIKGAKKNNNYYIGLIYSIFISLVFLGIVGLLCLVVTLYITCNYVLYLSYKNFEGLNGDGIGCSNEIGRLLYIILILIILKLIQIGDIYIWM